MEHKETIYSRGRSIYPSTNSREPYIYARDFVSIIYGEKCYQHLKVPWVPLLHGVGKKGLKFNWVNIFSHNLMKFLFKVKFSKLDSPP